MAQITYEIPLLSARGIFDRDAKSERIRFRQLKAKSMFMPEGINLDLGTGMKKRLTEFSGVCSSEPYANLIRIHSSKKRQAQGIASAKAKGI